ncbi:MAG: hypothetical protein LBU23_01445 [Planctomycetota bacterium]|jgi:hypothetical protein|nr:hypothetical protein [Planctomycetota bacterium]
MDFNTACERLTRICVDTFKERGGFVFTPADGGEARTVDAVFDRNHQMIELVDGAQVSSYRPIVKVHRKDFPDGVREGDLFIHVASGKAYKAMDVQEDSGYAAMVILHETETDA